MCHRIHRYSILLWVESTREYLYGYIMYVTHIRVNQRLWSLYVITDLYQVLYILMFTYYFSNVNMYSINI